jgi:hypothetical protein
MSVTEETINKTPPLLDLPGFLYLLLYFLFIFAVLGFELRAYTLSHSTSPFL